MFLHTIFLLIVFCCSYALGLENTLSSQTYTAEQHLQDIKMLLEPLKYKDHEISLFELKKRSLNQTINVLNEGFRKIL